MAAYRDMDRRLPAGQARALPPIAMDGRMLGPTGTGVATYARALRTAQAAIAGHACILEAGPAAGGLPIRLLAAATAGVTGARALRADRGTDGHDRMWSADLFRRAHLHFSLYGRLLPLRMPMPFGILHWSYPIPIRAVGWANLYTVHDMIPLSHPELSSIDPSRHRAVIAQIAVHAAGIVTVSQAAADAIVMLTGLTRDRVQDCSQPVEAGPVSDDPLPHGLATGGYMICYGSLEPRKNIAALIAAYRTSGVDMPLLLVGPSGWCGGPLLELIQATPGVLRLDYQPRPVLLGLVARARALLFPSLAEGFGLPVVEAMALGTPVLTSDRCALREVAGGAALLVDPESMTAIAAGIRRIASDGALHAWLSGAGRRRAADFAQDGFARRLEMLYGRVFDDRRPQ